MGTDCMPASRSWAITPGPGQRVWSGRSYLLYQYFTADIHGNADINQARDHYAQHKSGPRLRRAVLGDREGVKQTNLALTLIVRGSQLHI